MLKISPNKIITIERGDSGSFTTELNIGTPLKPEIYQMSEFDTLYFGVMEPNKPFEQSIIMKKYVANDLNADGTITIAFSPLDTEYLLPGTYYYAIKINSVIEDGVINNVYTVQINRKFIILG